jgi:DHA1 family bicyclomycin/chloramphenicol resistance-like MFS transporter
MVLGSYLARRAAGKFIAKKVVKFAYVWMFLVAILNIAVCYFLPTNLIYNIIPVALFNVGMALSMPILSIAALDRHPKIRGTAASGQAFIQMFLSTVSAGVVVPLVWFAPAGLAWAMVAYLMLGWLAIRQSKLWRQ